MNEIENLIRNHLSGTNRKTTKKLMKGLVSLAMPNITQEQYNTSWDNLITENYLFCIGNNTFVWE